MLPAVGCKSVSRVGVARHCGDRPQSEQPMKSSSCALACLVFALSVSSTGAIADPRSDAVVAAHWLAATVKEPDIVLLHVGDAGESAGGHSPGARMVTL